MVEAGIDTWRLNFGTHLAEPSERPVFDVGPYRASYSREWGILSLEGHPAPEGLCEPWSLEQAYQGALDALDEWGHRPGAFLGLSRLDSTATTRFPDAREGTAVLAGLAALDMPGCKPVVYGKPAETVGIIALNGRRTLGRVYDKGLELGEVAAGTMERGELVRFEDQRRFQSGRRPGRDDFHAEYVRGRFEHRFVPLYRAAKGVTVAGIPVLSQTLVDRLNEGELTARQAERLGGALLIELAGGARHYPKRTRMRRRAELRDHGLVLADDFFTPVAVELGEVLERALETPLWGARG